MPAPLLRRPRPARALALLLATLLVAPTPALAATPTVSLHWNDCAGPIDQGPGSGPVRTIVVSEDNLTGTTSGYQVMLWFGSQSSGLGDAWRFDTAGCEHGRWQASLSAGGATCPLLELPSPQSLSDWSYLDLGGGVARARLVFVIASHSQAAPPGARATLVRFLLDQSNATLMGTSADSCGCLGRPVCVTLATATYLDPQNNELSFQPQQPWLTWNDPTGFRTHCGVAPDCFPTPCMFDSISCSADQPTPAHPTSWGHVKGMYRAPAR